MNNTLSDERFKVKSTDVELKEIKYVRAILNEAHKGLSKTIDITVVTYEENGCKVVENVKNIPISTLVNVIVRIKKLSSCYDVSICFDVKGEYFLRFTK